MIKNIGVILLVKLQKINLYKKIFLINYLIYATTWCFNFTYFNIDKY